MLQNEGQRPQGHAVQCTSSTDAAHRLDSGSPRAVSRRPVMHDTKVPSCSPIRANRSRNNSRLRTTSAPSYRRRPGTSPLSFSLSRARTQWPRCTQSASVPRHVRTRSSGHRERSRRYASATRGGGFSWRQSRLGGRGGLGASTTRLAAL